MGASRLRAKAELSVSIASVLVTAAVPPVGDTGPRGHGTCRLPASLPPPAPLSSPMLCRGQPGMWEALRAGMNSVAPQSQGRKGDGGSLAWGTVGTPLGAPLPGLKHPGSSCPSAACEFFTSLLSLPPSPSMCFVQGTGEAAIPLPLHPHFPPSSCPSVPPSLLPCLHLYTLHPPAQPPGYLHFPCSFPLPSCRSRSCRYPKLKAPHPQENGDGSSFVISIRTLFQHLSMQPMARWLYSPFLPGMCPPLVPSALG